MIFLPHENKELHSKNKHGLFKPVLYPFHLPNSNYLTSSAKERTMNSFRKVKQLRRWWSLHWTELISPFTFEIEVKVQQFGTSYTMHPLVGIFIVRIHVKIC